MHAEELLISNEKAGSRPPTMARPADLHRLPAHLAIIMDGNGRWATQRGLARAAGHQAGAEAVRRIVRACREWGLPIVTLYAFSTENWNRPETEVAALMSLLVTYLQSEADELHEAGIRVQAIGRTADLPAPQRAALAAVTGRTENNTGMTLNLALNYGARTELVDAVRAVAAEVASGALHPDDVNEAVIARHLYTAGQPDPDLVIRCGGESRLSNFLLWQVAYAEFWVTPTFWPDFTEEDLAAALRDFQQRERRFGGLNGAAHEPRSRGT